MRWDEENSGQMECIGSSGREWESEMAPKTAPDHASYAKCSRAKAVYYLPSRCFAHTYTRIYASLNCRKFCVVVVVLCRYFHKMSAKQNDGSISLGYLLRFDDSATAVPNLNFWIRREKLIVDGEHTGLRRCNGKCNEQERGKEASKRVEEKKRVPVFKCDLDASSCCTIFSSLISYCPLRFPC